VCMETIDCPTKAPCGHSFHFECLFRWGREHNSCPLCRGELIKIEKDEEDERFHLFTGVGGYGRTALMDILAGTAQTLDRNIRQEVERRYRARPIEQYTGESPDPIDVQLVAEQADVSPIRAATFLKYFEGDIVDTIMFLTMSGEGELAIPAYRDRGLPRPAEPYVRRHHKDRMLYEGRATGYESS